MPYEEKMNDMASWACHSLECVLNLPPVPGAGDEYDKEVHEAFTTLSMIPDEIRYRWMESYNIPRSFYDTWAAVSELALNNK